MASTFKTFLNNDVISSRTLLHEAIPLTGTIASGTYSDNNIKNYSHGMFQSVYDYPYLSSSSNHLFDITCGFAANSQLSGAIASAPANGQQSKKINIYNQMAQVLMGYNLSGSIRLFDQDGDLTDDDTATTGKYRSCVFINFSRLLIKDEIKKGTFKLEFGMVQDWDEDPVGEMMEEERIKLTDIDAATSYKINSPAGEYGILIADTTLSASGEPATSVLGNLTNDSGSLATGQKAGLIFYQAGIAVIPTELFMRSSSTPIDAASNDATAVPTLTGFLKTTGTAFASLEPAFKSGTSENIEEMMVSSSIQDVCDGVRARIYNIEFNNTTELNSTIYFCRINNNDFNYSSNPTYLSGSKMVVKNTHSDEPITYMTTVGLYSAANELLAVAKLSEPLKKTPSNEFTLRVRLDY
ncbi:hypothetical protein CL622_08440 [archaeon]|nr:hypothetical protein [archaeon]